MWKFSHVEAIKDDLELALYWVEIKLFWAEETECTKLLKQEGAQSIWAESSLSG